MAVQRLLAFALYPNLNGQDYHRNAQFMKCGGNLYGWHLLP